MHKTCIDSTNTKFIVYYAKYVQNALKRQHGTMDNLRAIKALSLKMKFKFSDKKAFINETVHMSVNEKKKKKQQFLL